MNLATDAWHGFWDSVEKGFENADIRSRKAALYKKSRSELTAEMFESVLRIHFAVLEVLEQHKSKIDINCLAPGAKDKARAIVNNFDKMSKEEVLAILPQVFLLNPYDERLYKKLYSLFGDKDGGIEKAANYFDVDTSFIAKEKEALAERLFADVKGELGKSEQSALEAKKKFELAIASNNVNDTESARKNLKTIESRLQDYDVKARTVEGEVFSSRQDTHQSPNESRPRKKKSKKSCKNLTSLIARHARSLTA